MSATTSFVPVRSDVMFLKPIMNDQNANGVWRFSQTGNTGLNSSIELQQTVTVKLIRGASLLSPCPNVTRSLYPERPVTFSSAATGAWSLAGFPPANKLRAARSTTKLWGSITGKLVWSYTTRVPCLKYYFITYQYKHDNTDVFRFNVLSGRKCWLHNIMSIK